jgi:hypothetical protein
MTTILRTLTAASLITCVSVTCACSSDKKTTPTAKTYELSIPATDQAWKRPRQGSAKEFGAYVPAFMFTVSGSDVLVGTALGNGEQDPCTPTAKVTASAPETQIGPFNMKLHVSNGVGGAKVMSAYNVTFNSIISNTASGSIPPGQFLATLDARDLYSLVYKQTVTPESLCNLLEKSYASPCIACPSGAPDSATFCIELMAAGLAAAPADSAVQPVDESDVSGECESATPADAGM